MKKIFALLLVTIICLGGCTGEKKDDTKDKSSLKNSIIDEFGDKDNAEKESETDKENDSNNGFGNDVINDGNKTIECPDFTGMKVEEITSGFGAVLDIDLKYDYNNTMENGRAYDQSIKAGKELAKGTKITVYISKGAKKVKVPDVYGKQESAAISQLKAVFASSNINIVRVASEMHEKGSVIKTEPAKGTSVPENSDITVYISSGKDAKMVKVPDVLRMTRENAESLIHREDLTVKFVEASAQGSNLPKGYVFKQEPSAGNLVPERTEIVVYISNGN